ncbi:dioxygenase [Amylocarpus encephaloides]|uniref:Dioxygenase n=1 Tax=Amylocarpus encephaloides TaxID=45428 RepID=A0A9P7YAD5_9HELO|nr:dioxygenase [Amylocarpus encephaloides]
MHFPTSMMAAGLLVSLALAHPGPHAHATRSETQKRNVMAKRCAGAAAAMNEKRYSKRNLEKKRSLEARANATYQITTEAPYYEVIQNDTCVLTPEVTQGPYVWPRSQTLRQDMSEGQAGIPFWLDVGVLDMATCGPLANALVDFWHCNGTGSYSSFVDRDPNTGFVNLLNELNITDFEIGVTDLHTDDSTFLRGMWPTDTNGMMEMKTIYPGFYIERAIHIHAQVHTDWVLHENGTIVSENTVSTGQLYMPEELNVEMMKLEPYASHTQINRTTNDEDNIISQSTDGGYSPYISVVPADGVNPANGVIGYITIGVDTTDIQIGDAGGAGGGPRNTD